MILKVQIQKFRRIQLDNYTVYSNSLFNRNPIFYIWIAPYSPDIFLNLCGMKFADVCDQTYKVIWNFTVLPHESPFGWALRHVD